MTTNTRHVHVQSGCHASKHTNPTTGRTNTPTVHVVGMCNCPKR